MKRQIRNGVFETNSSSCHSLSINKVSEIKYDKDMFEYRIHEDDNKLHIGFGEFGWGYDVYTDPLDKLEYALTMVLGTECWGIDDFYETKGFKLIDEFVRNTFECDGVVIDDKIDKISHQPTKWDNEKMTWVDDLSKPVITWLSSDGYIDHQSLEDYSCLQDFLDDWSVTLEDFVLNPGIKLIIDNDNH